MHLLDLSWLGIFSFFYLLLRHRFMYADCLRHNTTEHSSHSSDVLFIHLLFGYLLIDFLYLQDSPDVILCGWLGSKHQLTKSYLQNTSYKSATDCAVAENSLPDVDSPILQSTKKRDSSLICWFYTSAVGVILCQITKSTSRSYQIYQYSSGLSVDEYIEVCNYKLKQN